jgi:hypothetical protein
VPIGRFSYEEEPLRDIFQNLSGEENVIFKNKKNWHFLSSVCQFLEYSLFVTRTWAEPWTPTGTWMETQKGRYTDRDKDRDTDRKTVMDTEQEHGQEHGQGK